jgi:hypothetical protein
MALETGIALAAVIMAFIALFFTGRREGGV